MLTVNMGNCSEKFLPMTLFVTLSHGFELLKSFIKYVLMSEAYTLVDIFLSVFPLHHLPNMLWLTNCVLSKERLSPTTAGGIYNSFLC